MSLIIILQTVRLPNRTDQYIVPRGASLSRSALNDRLSKAKTCSEEYVVVQPGTNRRGTERLIALHGEILTEDTQLRLRNFLNQKISDRARLATVIEQAGHNILSSGNELPSSELLDDWTKTVHGDLGHTSANPIRNLGSHLPRTAKEWLMVNG